MSAMQSIVMTVCYTCVAIAALSSMIPQKRTKRIMSFVIGIFFISTFISAVYSQWKVPDQDILNWNEPAIAGFDEGDYQDAVAQQTADNLTLALNDLLQNEGISVQDIRLTLKISDEGRISVVRAVIYITESDPGIAEKTKSIVYRNIAKEPEVYVQREVQSMAE